MSKRTAEEAAYRRGYVGGYAAGRRRAENLDALKRPLAPAPVVMTTLLAGFDMPGGHRIEVQFPHDVTTDDLDFFEEALGQYLTLYRRRLADANPMTAGRT